jgi:hypothetical protein
LKINKKEILLWTLGYNQKKNFVHKINLSFSTTDRDRPVSVTKLCSQISHPNCTLFTVPLILNQSTGLKPNINVSKTASKIILEFEK